MRIVALDVRQGVKKSEALKASAVRLLFGAMAPGTFLINNGSCDPLVQGCCWSAGKLPNRGSSYLVADVHIVRVKPLHLALLEMPKIACVRYV